MRQCSGEAMIEAQRERELKFDVPDGFRVTDALGSHDGIRIETIDLELSSTYYDTDEHDLLRQRITLRRREGDDDTGWHLKVPSGIARTELRVPLEAGSEELPPQLARLVRGISLGKAVREVAVLRTHRVATRAYDTDQLLFEIADDTVAATDPRAPGLTQLWHEVEIELKAGDERLLAAIVRRMTKRGATESSSPSKLQRALGDPAIAPTNPASALVHDYLNEQLLAIAAGDVALRRGKDPIHKTRVAVRRFRSILRVLRPLWRDADAAAALDVELSWYQDLLGAVRDREVQRARFAEALRGLPVTDVLGPVAAHIEETLLSDQVIARTAVDEALDSERYFALLRSATSWAGDPPLAADVTRKDILRRAAKARATAAKRLSMAIALDDPEQLHRARKAAKRARYATELTAAHDRATNAKKLVKRYKRVQDVLGEHQDSTVAADFLHQLGTAADRDPRAGSGFTYGLLYEREHNLARRMRDKADQLKL
jgi:CHAD domain-containing protein